MEEFDLFGDKVEKDVILKEEFLENPFTILDAKSGAWQNRKRNLIRKGIKSDVGRDASVIHMDSEKKETIILIMFQFSTQLYVN